jgi:carbamoyl-phosphate synthase/aspartate carbamoyltransferase
MSSFKSSPAFEDAVPSSSVSPSQSAQGPAATAHSAVVEPTSPSPAVTRAQEALVAPAPTRPVGSLHPPATLKGIDYQGVKQGDVEWDESMGQADCVLELADGLALSGHSFGAKKSIAGECVFQTGKFAFRQYDQVS